MPSVLGLDLGQHTFRAVEIEVSKKGTFLNHYGVYDNQNIDFDGTDADSQKEYSHAIKEFIKDSGFSTPQVIISLEDKDIFMRVISVPQMSDKELSSSIMFEAEQYIPLPIKEVNLSYQVLDIPTNEPGRVSVQLVAARKDIIQKSISLVKEAKLTPVGIEPEALSIGRALGEASDASANIILHLGYRKSLIIVALKGFVVFNRTLSIGGDAMTRALSQALNLDYIQAEEYKKAYGLMQEQAEGRIYEVIKPMFDSINDEIGRAQVFFTTHHPGVTINKVLLSGGTALMPGLLLYMANNLSLEVELANPFKKVAFSKDLESKKEWLMENGPLFTAPVGLALKEF